ncbi:MAG: CHASE2 domain-containing protein, partial [Calditrichota bacterium]
MKFTAGNVVTSIVLIALAVIFGLYSLANNTTRRYDDRAFDYFTALRTFSQEKFVEEAAIVLIDEAAISPYGYYDPVPRRYLAKLLDSLNTRQPGIIALDIALLDRFVADSGGDSLLAESLQRAGNVIGICLQEERGDTLLTRQPASLFAKHFYDIGHAMLEVGGGVFGRVKGIKPYLESKSDSIPAFGLVLAKHFSGREIQVPEAGAFGLRLNYSGPPGKWEQAGGGWIQVEEGAIPTSRSSLLTGNTPLPAALFKERVVFIGGGIETAKDRFYTPFATAVFDERLMHGVEVHANAFLMFLNGSYLPKVSTFYHYLLFVLTAVLAVALAILLRFSRSLPGLFLLIVTIWLGAYLVFVLQSKWIPVTGLTATAICGFLLAVMIVMYQKHQADRRSRVISHYALEKQLGEGAMGNVFLARDKESGKKVAVKVLHEALLKDEENHRRLNSEGFILSSFDHPNIVKAYEVGDSDGRKFIAMEYLSGGTLADFLKEHHPL